MLTELAPRLVNSGYDVTVYVRNPYTGGKKGQWEYNGVKLISLPCIRNKYLETPIFTFVALFHSLKYNFDVYYFHAVVTGMFIPFARLFGKRVLLQTHGLDWKREKWGIISKAIIKLSTFLGIKFANIVTSVSLEEVNYFSERYRKLIYHTPNGISMPETVTMTDEIKKFNIEADRYILFLSRLVPEKGCHFLIEAYNKLENNLKKKYKLVIAGDTQYKDKYYYSLKSNESENIIFTGFAVGELKRQLLSHAAVFVQPSTMEGMPLAVLEAMAYGLPVIGSDIQEISDIIVDKSLLFKSGNTADLTEKLNLVLTNQSFYKSLAELKKSEVINKYDWNSITKIISNLIEKL
ncbi:MAG: Alpha-D-GlcNAc alpha-1,2-L-rhamnosyltransferase [Ignavibacteriae bacterium]|nr:MAG: Alpha-D-GlcNAc alpha-1,2-L-rhamnosyltransferase [Ignavibacteriota bacterium]